MVVWMSFVLNDHIRPSLFRQIDQLAQKQHFERLIQAASIINSESIEIINSKVLE